MPSLKSLALLGLLFTHEVSAHGLWTEQRRGNIEVIYGHGAEDSAFKAQKISGAWAYDISGKMIPVTVQRLPDHARLQPLKAPAVIAVLDVESIEAVVFCETMITAMPARRCGPTASSKRYQASAALTT